MKDFLKVPDQWDKKIPFSQLVGQAVDIANLRERYKWVDNIKIAKHIQQIIDILLANHELTIQNKWWEDAKGKDEGIMIINNKNTAVGTTGLQAFTQNQGISEFYRQLPWIMINSTWISAHDKILAQTVMALMAELQFNVENDIALQADVITESIITTRVPDWKPLREYIDREETDWWIGMWFADWSTEGGKLWVEILFRIDIRNIPGDFGIDPKYKEAKLYRVMKNKVNKFSHTPFEYFHTFDCVKTNKDKKPIYLIRTYTTQGSSIVALLDSELNFLNPTFPIIDDAKSDEFFWKGWWCKYDIWRYAGGSFFKYKEQMFIIKNGKYARPDFADQLAWEKFRHVTRYEDKKWYHVIHTEKNKYLTDNYFRVLGKSVEEVDKLLKEKNKK